ncbi:hypothetical protein BaRGS_00036444 [Batillaria attramentaria]|uniref:TLDc domain-containing protein n=1 Tax=Batillaria attramentaria TaxID=370345 RepID=A0ABD0JBW2_9CAEN
MGNSHGHKSSSRGRNGSEIVDDGPQPDPRAQSASILKLFEKLELTADEGNTHPGELSRKTFENAFHGPLHKFGKLMYKQMLSQTGQVDRDRITREAFVAAGTAIVSKFSVADQRKYYFKLFSGGKDYLTKEDALQMVHVSYMLMVSVSKITYNHDDRDIKVFEGMVTSMFGIEERLNCTELEAWLATNCPNMFSGVHNWVCTVLNGSNLPSEMEARTAHVPQLENFICGQHCLSLGMAWALASVLPNCYTHIAQASQVPGSLSPNQKNPLITSYHLLLSMNWLPRVQSWSLLYSSERDGLSKNRFVHHVMSYHGPVLLLLSFEGGNQYCLALDVPLKEGIQKYGGKDCRLIQLLPVYRVKQAGAKLVMWNTTSRNCTKGLLIGQDGKPLVLRVDEDFDRIYHYDVPCAFHRMEVWGCGGDEVKQAQIKQKQWEARDTERQRTRKLRLEDDWRENPDKQILEWGGVRTGSSYLANR